MSTIPSLALIPSGYKGGTPTGTLYSVLPLDGVGDFEFKRGGNYNNSGNGTRVNKDGLLELISANVPRLNYPLIDGVVQDCPSLLLEPLSTNLITYSEDFTNASDWTTSNATVFANQIISPDGTKNASTVKYNASNGFILYQTNPRTVVNGQSITISIFTKTSSRIISFGGVTPSGTDFYSTDEYSNGWYRQKLTRTFNITTSEVIQFVLSNVNFEEYNIWGAQLEDGSYASSYIPSLGGTTTTRFSESSKNSGTTNIYNDSEGVLFLEVENINIDPRFYRTVCINNGGTSNNRVSINYLNGYIRANVKVNDTTQFQSSKLIDPNTKHKIAVKYKNNDFGFYVDGEIVETQNFGYTFTENTLSKIDFDEGKGTFVSNPFYGNVNDLRYYNTALTDLQIQELTTL
jgi:hypothetical protein